MIKVKDDANLSTPYTWMWYRPRRTGWIIKDDGKEYLVTLFAENIKVTIKFVAFHPTAVLREACRIKRTYAELVSFFKDWQ